MLLEARAAGPDIVGPEIAGSVLPTWQRMTPGAPVASAVWRILVVESATEEADLLISGLRRHGHQVVGVTTGCEAFQAYADVDLVLMDLELSDLDGLEVCRTIRSVCNVPLIVFTSRGTELDCVLGLQAGADDCITRPYGIRELMARIEAVMRRSRPWHFSAGEVLCGALRIDPGSREVSVDGRSVVLTRKEFDLLHLLASQPGTVIPRKRLLQQVWGDSWSQRTVDTHVSRLRSKLGASGWIVTVRGVGFKLGYG